MNNKIISNGGYIGILMILISVTIIVFIMVRSDLFTQKQEGEKTVIEQDLEAVNQAKAVKALVEQNSQKSLGQ